MNVYSNEAFTSRVTLYCLTNNRGQQYWRTICRRLMLSSDTCYRLLTPALVWNIHLHSHEAQIWFQIILTTVLKYVNILNLKSLMQCHNCIRMFKVWITKILYLMLVFFYSCDRTPMGLRERKASALEKERQGVMVRYEPFFGQGKKHWGTFWTLSLNHVPSMSCRIFRTRIDVKIL